MQAELRFDSAASLAMWYPINDVVMGGKSSSRLSLSEQGHAVFEGCVSLENGGGFASIRANTTALAIDGIVGYRLTVLGDGKRYKLNLRTNDAFDGVNYQAEFLPTAGDWCTVDLPLTQFTATYRWRLVANAPPLDPAQVRQVGWMNAARQAGPFQLGLQCVQAY
jgi:NADH dehydrogenase [ubiquinone] 1 alpha subcomplex assembly factor 1